MAAEAPVPPPPDTREPRFEAMAVRVSVGPGDAADRVVKRVGGRAGLRGWRAGAVDAASGEFELVPPDRGRRLSPSAAWETTYRLRQQPEVVHAEPLFAYDIPDQHRRPPVLRAAGTTPDPRTDDCEWSLKSANVIAAWSLFGARQPGAGVTVGHPDTGYTPHPELADAARLLHDQGFDFDDDDPDPIDDLDDEILDNPGHGTGTGSVIASGQGAAAGSTPTEFVSGAAPAASLIPIRTTESVVLFSMRGLRRAIDHAVAKGCQVISISLGGPLPSLTLRAAVRRAVDAGTIVLAAAGNQVRVVVFPAAFDEVIAVAANTVADVPWPGSCRGDAVDITAPGASVWRARVERAAGGAFAFSVKRGDGTSFAVATTAGIAALWVSFHGWTTLVRRYGAGNISRVFKSLLQQTCRTPAGWDRANFGPGIVDAHQLLSAPLPDQPPARKLRDPRRAAVAADAVGLEAILHLMPEAPRTGVERALAEMLGVPERDLPSVLQDVGEELAFQLVMQPPLRAAVERRAMISAAAPKRAAVRRGTARAAAPMAGTRLMSPRLRKRLRVRR
jgi:thermitase